MKTFCFLFLALLAACGSDDSSSTPAQTENGTSPVAGACESAGTALCERACACATDGQCHLGVATDAGVASINFVDEKACRDLYVVLACSTGGEPGFDYGRCESATRASACVDTAGGKGGLMPAECKIGK